MAIVIFIAQRVTGIPLAGIHEGCSVAERMAFPLQHVSLTHLLLNVWCFLSEVFYYRIGIKHLTAAYAANVVFPFPSTLTVGMSGICFFLMGVIAHQVQRKVYFHLWVLAVITAGFVLPNLLRMLGCDVTMPNNFLHVYCYLIGFIYAA